MTETGTTFSKRAETRLEHVALYRWWRRAMVGNVDHEAIIERIVAESVWSPRYLFMTMMSAGIAVLGLLLSSPAVVIGAMLISPLMSPILGLGFSLALFDFAEMRRALIALAAGSACAVAFTATIVLLSPLQAATAEIIARTRPNLFDLVVALFAALAGTFAIIRGRGAKVVAVGDPEQLQAIEAGASFRSIAERHGAVEITTVRRQSEDWQRQATRQLANGRTGEALAAYDEAGHVHAAGTREQARETLIDRWDKERQAHPDANRIILTHTNDEVRELNEAARGRMRAAQMLGDDIKLVVERGSRAFATGDRVMFLQNERSLEVKNGTLGTVEHVSPIAMRVRTDDGRAIAFDLKHYAHVDHGYAATIHKAQGMTVGNVHVLATPGLDRHAAYVALSRHRDSVDLHYGKDDFADRSKLVRALSRERGKDMASDYARVTEPVPQVQPRRGIFDGLKLKPSPLDRIPTNPNFDGLRLKVSKDLAQPTAPPPEIVSTAPGAESREAQLRHERTDALQRRHARAIDAIYSTRDRGGRESPEQLAELRSARLAFEEQRPDGPRDAEAAYAKDPHLASEAAQGRTARAIRALQLETELRTNPELRADRFITRWNDLSGQVDRHYAVGNMDAYKSTRSAMADMTRGLHRDPQLESLLAIRKAQLGITMMDSQRSLGAQLAFDHGIDLGRGRGLGL